MTAPGRIDQAEQHPDGGGLAGPVGPQEPVDRSARHPHAQVVHGQLAATEPLGQPGGGDRRGQIAHLASATSRYRTAGVTAPTSTWPLLVSRMDTRLVCSSLPLPQAPCTGVAEPSRAPRIAPSWPGPAATGSPAA